MNFNLDSLMTFSEIAVWPYQKVCGEILIGRRKQFSHCPELLPYCPSCELGPFL